MEIESKPGSVRGLGNVVEKRPSEEYITNHSNVTVSSETETVPYQVMVMSHEINSVVILSSSNTFKQELLCSVDCTLVSEEDQSEVVSGETIKFYIDDVLTDTGVTGDDGMVSFTFTPSNFGHVQIKLVHEGNNRYGEKVLLEDKVILRKCDYTYRYFRSMHNFAVVFSDTQEPVENVKIKLGPGVGPILYTNSGGQASYSDTRHQYTEYSLELEDHYFVEVN